MLDFYGSGHFLVEPANAPQHAPLSTCSLVRVLIVLQAEAAPLQLPIEWDPLDLPSLLPPDPVQVPRRILNQQFAVLLLRSAYEVGLTAC